MMYFLAVDVYTYTDIMMYLSASWCSPQFHEVIPQQRVTTTGSVTGQRMTTTTPMKMTSWTAPVTFSGGVSSE